MAKKIKVTIKDFILYVGMRWGKNHVGYRNVNLKDVRKWIRYRDKLKKEKHGI